MNNTRSLEKKECTVNKVIRKVNTDYKIILLSKPPHRDKATEAPVFNCQPIFGSVNVKGCSIVTLRL